MRDITLSYTAWDTKHQVTSKPIQHVNDNKCQLFPEVFFYMAGTDYFILTIRRMLREGFILLTKKRSYVNIGDEEIKAPIKTRGDKRRTNIRHGQRMIIIFSSSSFPLSSPRDGAIDKRTPDE